MIVLGISGALGHDASAAILIDGKIIAAAEEERFIRDKHAKNQFPYEATKFCLKQAGIKAEDVDIVAFPYAEIPLTSKARWHYAKRHWYAPDRALDALFNGNRRFRRNRDKLLKLMADLGLTNAKFVPVEHHLAHASSAYHLSGFKEKTAIVGIDGKGEYATTFLVMAKMAKFIKLKSFMIPILSVACMARSPNIWALKCSMANLKSWVWHRMAMPVNMIYLAWRLLRMVSW